MFVYTCAVVLTEHVDGTGEIYVTAEYDPWVHFGNLGLSMFTLFTVLTLENWPSLVRPLCAVTPEFYIFFMFYILITHFTILNLFVAVIVENVQEAASTVDLSLMKDVQEKRLNTLSRLQDAFVKADEDGSGSVTLEELEQVAEDPDVTADFENLDIHPSELSWIFETLDA